MVVHIVVVQVLTALVALGAVIFAFTPPGRQLFSRRFRGGNRLRLLMIGLGIAVIIMEILEIIYHHHHLLVFAAEVGKLAVVLFVGLLLLRQRILPPGSLGRPQTVLAIGAHPDDLELACSGTLVKLADEGAAVHVLVLTDGCRGGDSELRPEEARRGALFMNVASLTQHTFTDTRLAEESVELVAAIEERIEALRPDLILTHSPNDQHQDHQAVHEATLRAARRHPSILCYESPSATRAFNPSFFVDISDYLDAKVFAVATHRDQTGKPYMQGHKLKGMAVFRGSQAKVDHAEGFEVVRLLDRSLGGAA
ncbi:MAG: PIG-L deacetylase family protein [Corynebacterium sp.]|uniref:PIG-L deacetylase family protein n=1 Tax=Corynebacterium sp. TaxID=1720 RepID=UPI0026DF733D|nr:PIG-L deacetylase family protein [Corynebacterium sp.]MDO5670136.1 PIG-L deacetylase family protein [Corynebacterium sp.]